MMLKMVLRTELQQNWKKKGTIFSLLVHAEHRPVFKPEMFRKLVGKPAGRNRTGRDVILPGFACVSSSPLSPCLGFRKWRIQKYLADPKWQIQMADTKVLPCLGFRKWRIQKHPAQGHPRRQDGLFWITSAGRLSM